MATGRDGIAQPAQLPRMSIPNGRGRSTVANRTTSRTAKKEPTNTTKWRMRRNASNATRVAQRTAPTTPTDPVDATIASMRPVIPGRRSPASHRTTASSQTVTATPRLRLAGPKATLASVTSRCCPGAPDAGWTPCAHPATGRPASPYLVQSWRHRCTCEALLGEQLLDVHEGDEVLDFRLVFQVNGLQPFACP